MKVPSGGPDAERVSNRLTALGSLLEQTLVKVVEHNEGRTRLIVPAASLEIDPPPTSPVFFNPAAHLNRDVSVAIAAASGGRTFCDSMAGVGARGIRIANEVKRVSCVALVDFNSAALGLARRSAVLNHVGRKCEFTVSETSSYLFSRYGREKRFDCVDLDPFGTPVGQLQGAICATADGGILSVTATDTAVLCGVYPKVARRRYGAFPLNNSFNHETAIRLLAGAVARIAATLDIGAWPVASHSTRHYVRLFLRVGTGASKADSALSNLGHVIWCPSCGHTRSSPDPVGICGECESKAKAAGPLWIGGLAQTSLLHEAAKGAGEMGFDSAAEVLRGQVGVDDFPPWSYSIERICSSLRVATVPEERVHRKLQDAGYRAMRTPFEKTGIKTDAGFEDVVMAVRAAYVPSKEPHRQGLGAPRRP